MIKITISKTELKKAYTGGDASHSQKLTSEDESEICADVLLLKIMLENNSSTNNPKEAA
jgi:predicted HAD superfamily hydrolase